MNLVVIENTALEWWNKYLYMHQGNTIVFYSVNYEDHLL